MAYEKFTRLGLTVEKLGTLYETHTDAQIAALYGVAELTVRRWRRKAGVTTSSTRKRKDSQREGLTLELLTEALLRELAATHTDEEIGAMCGVSKFPIRRLRGQFGIKAVWHGPRPHSAMPSVEPPLVESPSVETGATQPRMSDEDARAREAERARGRRARGRLLNPVKSTRSFTCETCNKAWETDLPGNFRTCPSCRETAEMARRTKTCAYGVCGQVFVDTSPKNGMLYHTEECRRRAKVGRGGLVPPSGFLSERTYTCQNPDCGKLFTPEVAGQKFCTPECRHKVYSGGDAARIKDCVHCEKTFVDTSPKNNQRAHPACSRAKWGSKPNPTRSLDAGARLVTNRRDRVRLGDGGRLDDIKTMTKDTHSWWGRVSELIFAAYRPAAEDVNLKHGGRSPFDFQDPTLGRVDVRSSQERVSPQGRSMWVFQVDGLKESCDTAFLVGYADGGASIAHLWVVPIADLNNSLVRMAPGSAEYLGHNWDVTGKWGTMLGDAVLATVRAFPDPVKPEKRFSWVADPTNFIGGSTTHRGRRGEFLYKVKYPDSKDMNEAVGMLAEFDFLDLGGAKVNVKTSKRAPRSDRPTMLKWSFSLLNAQQVLGGHKCDIYSCLCLDETGTTVLKEYRIPSSVLGGRRLIHIYDNQPDGQWEVYLAA